MNAKVTDMHNDEEVIDALVQASKLVTWVRESVDQVWIVGRGSAPETPVEQEIRRQIDDAVHECVEHLAELRVTIEWLNDEVRARKTVERLKSEAAE